MRIDGVIDLQKKKTLRYSSFYREFLENYCKYLSSIKYLIKSNSSCLIKKRNGNKFLRVFCLMF